MSLTPAIPPSPVFLSGQLTLWAGMQESGQTGLVFSPRKAVVVPFQVAPLHCSEQDNLFVWGNPHSGHTNLVPRWCLCLQKPSTLTGPADTWINILLFFLGHI